MKYFIIAGEASGDLHGSNLMKALKQQDPEADFMFLGGDLMQSQGGALIRHYRDMAFMGAIDVIKNLGKIGKNFQLAREKLLEYNPDVLILIDYPGFNLKMAEFARKEGIRVFYYILPKVWAWKEWRVKKLKRYVDELFSILPFEEEFFSRHGLNVRYVGNPLPDAIDPSGAETVSRAEFLRSNGLPDKPLVALLPGSRAQEIRAMLPVMSRMASEFPEFAFLISGTRASDSDLYRKYSADNSLPVLFDQTYEMLRHAHAALVTSGTATLETALIGTPQIVLYKMAGGRIGYAIFKRLFLRVKYVSLPNLILDREAVREFVMHEMTEEKVRPETELLLKDQAYRNKILESYARLRDRMGEKGVSERTAATIFAKIRRSE
ncbi:MAG: lipid-A-disaccharide synthase [Prolixibacteraceae bacterium]|jgi:lipid-A-disaccharide synthase|nr:lipid-A-disaccharide synthase [Prolixibacteraceae bacterium]MDI9563275.1 lipid-A-disaccharide synthase [Bacteroidota bacterium]NLS99357.1 lipid-A-disaccharide synthase [Bacteroidales bacterium]OQB79028.1 MAG: Lipid-A-disaccharide synthase [Bacteroidetes bacterium ADurb.Bin123]HNZ68615.1 lipid-A-disaccharide synthase [Prolixibacteraceae bacterium]